MQVLQHAPWLGRLLSHRPRISPPSISARSPSPSIGRRHRNRERRLLAIANGLIAAAETGLKEHHRLRLARQMMARPLVHAGTVAKVRGVTPQAALRIVGELGLREMTGRRRFRARGILYKGGALLV